MIQLADLLDVKSSAVTVMLDRLELLGLTARVPDENDRRAVTVTLTVKGEELLKEAQNRSLVLLTEHLAILKPDELKKLADIYTMLETQERQ